MARFTEVSKFDRIEFVGDFKSLQIRRENQVLKDGEVISREFHRVTLSPGSDLTEYPQDIKNAAHAMWTQEILDAWAAKTDLEVQ